METSSVLYVGMVWVGFFFPHCEMQCFTWVLVLTSHRACLAFRSKYNIVTFLYMQSGSCINFFIIIHEVKLKVMFRQLVILAPGLPSSNVKH